MTTPTMAPPSAPAAKAPPTPTPPKPPTASGAVASQLARSATPSGVAAKQAVEIPADVPATVVELVGGAEFAPAAPVADYLAAKKGKPAQVRVQLGNIASGTIKVQRQGDRYQTPSAQAIPLLIPWLAPLRDIGIDPVLAVKIRGGQVEGYASVVTKGVRIGDSDAFLETLEKSAAALGWLGLEKPNLRGAQNTLAGPTLTVTAPQVSFGIAKFLTATGSFSMQNSAFTFDATATGKIAQLGTITVPIKGNPDGSISGSAQIDIAVKGFTGHATVVFARGLVDVRGEIGYSNDKFDGKVTIIATDAASAKEIVAGQIPGQQPAPAQTTASAPAPATPEAASVPVPVAGPKPGPRVVAGWGKVNVKLADWLTGDALVVVSPEWHVTVVGTITPRMNKPLFPQKDFAMVLFAPPELRASYGLPVIGNVFLFANIVLTAEARLGPATLKDMSITGTWSTDPKVLQSFGLTGTLNISGFAGLRLKASGGAGIEILSHDIKAGISVWALAGIKGYVEATPRIGYREIADPQAGKKGEFFIGGHMELAARPFLGLGGELFVELNSPWWSPLPDKRWPWDLGSIEYPLPGEFGIGADVEHILGSEKVPEVKFGSVDFNSEKFLTDLVSDSVPPKTSAVSDKKGAWKEPSAPTPEPVAPTTPAPAVKGQPTGAALPGAKAKPHVAKPRTAAQQKLWTDGVAAVRELATRSQKDPYTDTEIQAALKSIRRHHRFTDLTATADGAVWHVRGSMSPDEPIADVKLDPKVEPAQHSGQPPKAAPMKPNLHAGMEVLCLLAPKEQQKGEVVDVVDLSGIWFIKYRPDYGHKKTSLTVKAHYPNGDPAFIHPTQGQINIDFTGTTFGDRATNVSAQPLVWTDYLKPRANVPGWDRLTPEARWVRAHMVNGRVGGPGAAWNLAVVREGVNTAMRDKYEDSLREAVRRNERLKFKAEVDYYGDADVPGLGKAADFPRSISISYGPISPTDKAISGTWSSGGLPPPDTADLLPHRRIK